MNENSASTIPRDQWLRVALIAVALPVLLTVVNNAIASQLVFRMPMAFVVTVFAVYVGEMAAIAFAAGGGIRQSWLAWVLFVWLLLMIDLHLIVAVAGQTRGWNDVNGLSVAAFAVAQLGFLVVWAVLGGERWYLRLPVVAVIASAFLRYWYFLADALAAEQWNIILIIEIASIAFLSITLWLTRFRLCVSSDMQTNSDMNQMQFGLRHVLILITALAVVLGIARAAQMLTLPFLVNTMNSLRPWRIAVACSSAMLIVLAFWAALGKGTVWLRTMLITLGCMGVGFGLAMWSLYMQKGALNSTGRITTSLWERRAFWEVGYWWIAWSCLSTGLLTACLLFFRARGYRLARTLRPR